MLLVYLFATFLCIVLSLEKCRALFMYPATYSFSFIAVKKIPPLGGGRGKDS